MLKIYCDGSTRVKNKKGVENIGGFGIVVYNEKNEIIRAYSEQKRNTTNNEMELVALGISIMLFGTKDTWDCPTIYSDSMYAINCYTKWASNWERNNWIKADGKPVENKEIISTVYTDYLKTGKYNVNIEYCPGHSGIEGNELADKLATGELTPQEVLNGYKNFETRNDKDSR